MKTITIKILTNEEIGRINTALEKASICLIQINHGLTPLLSNEEMIEEIRKSQELLMSIYCENS